VSWLDGFEQVTFPHSLGFPYDRDIRGVCWHMTEGHKASHAYGVYASFPSCPHLTVDRREASQVKAQHVPLNLASYALRNLPGGCELGGTGIIQIEVVGFSAEAGDWTRDELRWLGEEVLAPILAACPTIPPSVFQGNARMTCDEWNAWPGGQVRHANCPENDHWDPGALDLDVVLHYALELLDHEPKDETLPDYIIRNAANINDDPWLAVYPTGRLRHIGGTEAGRLLDPTQGLVTVATPLIDEVDVNAYQRARSQAGA
jgi:hypothetical protein